MSTPATIDKRKCAQSPDKVKYANWARAREIADKRQKVEGRPLYVYACSSCGHWHISKKKGDEHVASIGAGESSTHPRRGESPRPASETSDS